MCTCVADRSQWELSTRDLKAEVWGVASDYENLMMNNNAKIVLCIWSTVFGQRTSLYELWVELCKRIWAWNYVRTPWRDWNLGPNGLHMRSKWAAWGLVKAPLGPTSPLEVDKVVMEADLVSSDKAFWDPFCFHFATFFVSLLHLSFLIIFSTFWDRFGGPSQPQKLVFR